VTAAAAAAAGAGAAGYPELEPGSTQVGGALGCQHWSWPSRCGAAAASDA
jgi:hypothetical protein